MCSKKPGFRKVAVGEHKCQILGVEVRYWGYAPRMVLFLKVENPVQGSNGVPVPFSDDHGCGGFKNEIKSLNRFKMSHPDKIRMNLKEESYVHPFILNNELYGYGSTNQFKFYQNMLKFIREHTGLDASRITEENVEEWEIVLSALLVGEFLLSGWAQWFHIEKTPFVGPDGDLLQLVAA